VSDGVLDPLLERESVARVRPLLVRPLDLADASALDPRPDGVEARSAGPHVLEDGTNLEDA